MLVTVLILSGCVPTFSSPRPLQLLKDHLAANPAMAIDTNGTKHYVWAECVTSNACSIIYHRTKVGETALRFQLTPPEGERYETPDIAVAEGGQVFIVWRSHSINVGTPPYHDFYITMPVTATIPPDRQELMAPETISAAPPLLYARSSTVYAIFSATTDSLSFTPNGLHYVQLSGGSRKGSISLSAQNVNANYAPSLAIDPQGNLHVAWLEKSLVDNSLKIHYSSNINVSAAMPASKFITVPGTTRSPLLLLAPDGTTYIATIYTTAMGSNEQINVFKKTAAGSSFTSTLAQLPGTWQIDGDLYGTVIDSLPRFVFAAANTEVATHQIWFLSSLSYPPKRITTTNSEHGDAHIVKMTLDSGDTIPIVAWRSYTVTVADERCYGNTYVSIYPMSTVKQVATGQGACSNEGSDIAVAGKWIGGIWVDNLSPQAQQHIPWISFNGHITHIPFVQR